MRSSDRSRTSLAGGNDRPWTEPVDGLLDVVAELFIQLAASMPVPDMCDVVGDLEQHGDGDEQFTTAVDDVTGFPPDTAEPGAFAVARHSIQFEQS